MSNKDKMLQLVLSDDTLSSFYEYNVKEFPTIRDALKSENPIVVAVATIISEVGRNSNKEIYNKIYNHLNQNIL